MYHNAFANAELATFESVKNGEAVRAMEKADIAHKGKEKLQEVYNKAREIEEDYKVRHEVAKRQLSTKRAEELCNLNSPINYDTLTTGAATELTTGTVGIDDEVIQGIKTLLKDWKEEKDETQNSNLTSVPLLEEKILISTDNKTNLETLKEKFESQRLVTAAKNYDEISFSVDVLYARLNTVLPGTDGTQRRKLLDSNVAIIPHRRRLSFFHNLISFLKSEFIESIRSNLEVQDLPTTYHMICEDDDFNNQFCLLKQYLLHQYENIEASYDYDDGDAMNDQNLFSDIKRKYETLEDMGNLNILFDTTSKDAIKKRIVDGELKIKIDTLIENSRRGAHILNYIQEIGTKARISSANFDQRRLEVALAEKKSTEADAEANTAQDEARSAMLAVYTAAAAYVEKIADFKAAEAEVAKRNSNLASLRSKFEILQASR